MIPGAFNPNASHSGRQRSASLDSQATLTGSRQANSPGDSPAGTPPTMPAQPGANQQPVAASLGTVDAAAAPSRTAGEQPLVADGPATQALPAVPERARATTVNWLMHRTQESSTQGRLQEHSLTTSRLRRTSSNLDLSLNEQTAHIRRTEQVGQNFNGETGAVRPSTSEQGELIQDEASLQAAPAHNEQPIGATRPVAASQVTRCATLEKAAFCQQAAYLAARELMDRPLSDEHQALIWRASKVRTEVLKRLPMGRSNVKTDAFWCNKDTGAGAGLHSTFRALAARELKFSVPNGSIDDHSYIRAALTAMAGSGSCGDHSLLALHLLGPMMEPCDRSLRQEQTGDGAMDHSWVRVEHAPSGVLSDSNPAVILDVWADGPVIDAEDGAFVNGEGLDLEELINKNDFGLTNEQGWDQPTCQRVHQKFLTFMRDNAATLEKEITAAARKRETRYLAEHAQAAGNPLIDFKNGPLAKIVEWAPTSVLEDYFLKELKRVQQENYEVEAGPSLHLNSIALSLAGTAPPELRHLDTGELANDIIKTFLGLQEPEERSLIPSTPSQLGLIP